MYWCIGRMSIYVFVYMQMHVHTHTHTYTQRAILFSRADFPSLPPTRTMDLYKWSEFIYPLNIYKNCIKMDYYNILLQKILPGILRIFFMFCDGCSTLVVKTTNLNQGIH